MAAQQERGVRPGDVVHVTGHQVGDQPTLGEVLEVLGASDREHYRIRWEDGHESTLYPGSDLTISRRGRLVAHR
jgi:hypothetical protein